MPLAAPVIVIATMLACRLQWSSSISSCATHGCLSWNKSSASLNKPGLKYCSQGEGTLACVSRWYLGCCGQCCCVGLKTCANPVMTDCRCQLTAKRHFEIRLDCCSEILTCCGCNCWRKWKLPSRRSAKQWHRYLCSAVTSLFVFKIQDKCRDNSH
jgi:hypothetical protein